MAIHRKIPGTKQEQYLTVEPFAIFCPGQFKAANVAKKLLKDHETVPIPDYGYLSYKGDRIYYCWLRLVKNRGIYTNRAPRKKSVKRVTKQKN